ncbi:MAG: TIGR01777 family oxidoreductase [Gemmatimonadaceae bacterium]
MATVLLGGSSGFIGSFLTRALERDGHRVVPLARGKRDTDTVRWDAEAGTIDTDALARLQPDIVINLAGEELAQRWTAARRRRIRDSRVNGTTALASALAILPVKPRVLVNASAMGYYGAHRGDELLDETTGPAGDFLSSVTQAWEHATHPASDAGIRVVMPRTSLVLGEDGGVLARLLLPFRLGIGGRLGDGHQWMSWISMDDWVRALQFCIATPALVGPVNFVSPEPVTNREFTATIARMLRRPAVFPVPAFVLELIFGEMANQTILASQRLVPKRLAGAGFEFRHPRLEQALRAVLTRSGGPTDR